jgi:HD-like signal output (HDOD) protein
MGDMSITTAEVTETIQQDPPVAAKVLSVANSAAYGFPNKTTR